MADRYDILIIGSGPGGYQAAIRAAQYGARVGVIEDREIGGVCLNRGCIPTKALLETVRVQELCGKAGDFGISVGEVSLDTGAIFERKDRVVEQLRKGVETLFKRNGIEFIPGRGSVDATTVEVNGDDGTRQIRADAVFIATGSVPVRPGIFPYDGERVATSEAFLSMGEIPQRVLIVGAGYIGCEIGSVLRAFGAEVTVVEMLDRVLPAGDGDVSKQVAKRMKKAGFDLRLETKVESMEATDAGVSATLDSDETVTADKALIAVGRGPNTEGLNLEAIGLETDERGFVPADSHGRTAVDGVYAVGDVTGRIQLAHLAAKQGLAAAAAATGHEYYIDERVVPACVFSPPEVGAVGLTEAEARDQDREVSTAQFPYKALGKALCREETDGFFKIVADADSGEVLGVHIVGDNAADIIGEAAMAMQLECTVEEIAHTIHSHPTLYEGLAECAERWLGLGIHG
jgi:dihydrolipoamide dehydrogenase